MTLRLVSNDQYIEFSANSSCLRSRLNQAFIDLQLSGGGKSARLEMLHHIHGWELVCYNDAYMRINSPLTINYMRLLGGIYQTFFHLERLPTDAERSEKRRQRQAKRRHQTALERRQRFKLIVSPQAC
ncbi:hypothetical protein [Marinibactrum halimedae]|uniref:Uncharacterized protein n=1 Tax=Marinibactrum halimedae TaxID=1444977 RepID=A0AA37TDR8_9GAMM|nr:hypothetical protein [Marinibactrum halimedae]MCD9459195.1 hypothetical protein [Marinibactrum halimedae]GLS27267.1 hypothetical protein GCM10007877_29860 [Marinibactrum halimedae]